MDKRTQRTSRSVYDQDFITTISRDLKALKPKAPDRVSARHVIESLRGDFVEAITRKNYSFEDLCRLLGDKGLAIRPATLREYLGPISKDKSSTLEAAVPPSRKELKPAATRPGPSRSRDSVSSSDQVQQQHAGFEEEV